MGGVARGTSTGSRPAIGYVVASGVLVWYYPVEWDEAFAAVEEEGMEARTLAAVIHREEDMYVAECPEVGTVSQGTSIEDAVANLREATELYLEEFPLGDVERPILTTFEITAHA